MLQDELRPYAALGLGCFLTIIGFSMGALFAASAIVCEPLPEWVIQYSATHPGWLWLEQKCTPPDLFSPASSLSLSVGLIGFGTWSYGLVKIQPD